ncbi:MAG: hypothetical protein LUF87_09055 [Alistipes sp.]|nr:hypothetical protein [Alistipes sp.]
MKFGGYIFLITVVILSYACSGKSGWTDDEEPEARGSMFIEITERNGITEDRMETVRFIVFKEATTDPRLEYNALYIMEADPDDGIISRFGATLELSRKKGFNDKLVIALINEPPEITARLEALTTYESLCALELNFGYFLDTAHSGLKNGRAMPMSGAVWTGKVYPTPEEAALDPVKINVVRAAARVEVYLKKDPDMDFELAADTRVVLDRTYDREMLLRHTDGSNTVGGILTVSSGFLSRMWTLSGSDDKDLPADGDNGHGRPVCTFFTPERTCSASGNTDKLMLTIDVATSEGAVRSAQVTVDRFLLGGTEKNIEVIERNNNYRVIISVGANAVSSEIIGWNDEEIITEL